MKLIFIISCMVLLFSCDTLKKDEDQIKKIAEDAIDEEVDKVIKELP